MDDKYVDSASAGAQFLRSLPENINPYHVLKGIAEVLGDDLSTEIMRELLDPCRSQLKYVGRADPTGNTKPIDAIKEIRAIVSCGLREAKDFIEGNNYLTLTTEQARQINIQIMPYGYAVKRWYL